MIPLTETLLLVILDTAVCHLIEVNEENTRKPTVFLQAFTSTLNEPSMTHIESAIKFYKGKTKVNKWLKKYTE